MLRTFLGLAACLLGLSCHSVLGPSEALSRKADDLIFSTDRISYIAGDSVVLRLENRSDITFSYNLCGTGLERETTNGSWVPVPAERTCTLSLKRISPGGTADYTLQLPWDTLTGQHRFWTEVEYHSGGEGKSYEGGKVKVFTNEFGNSGL